MTRMPTASSRTTPVMESTELCTFEYRGTPFFAINITSAIIKGSGTSSAFKLERLGVEDGDFMFLQNFFEAYYRGEDTAASVSADNSELVTLSVDTGLSNQYKAEARLVLDTAQMKPLCLEIKGRDGKTYSKLEYTEFKINPELGDELFRIS